MTPKEEAQLRKLAYKRADDWFNQSMRNATSLDNQMFYTAAFIDRVTERLHEFLAVKLMVSKSMQLPFPKEDDDESV